MEIQEMIEVLHHAEKGGAVECRLRTNADTWGEANPILWNFNAYDYRIKPEPKRVPLNQQDLIERELSGKTIFLNIDGETHSIISFNTQGVYICCMNKQVSYEKLLTQQYFFADGTPCSKEVECE